eukprot:gene9501-biopygen16729
MQSAKHRPTARKHISSTSPGWKGGPSRFDLTSLIGRSGSLCLAYVQRAKCGFPMRRPSVPFVSISQKRRGGGGRRRRRRLRRRYAGVQQEAVG